MSSTLVCRPLSIVSLLECVISLPLNWQRSNLSIFRFSLDLVTIRFVRVTLLRQYTARLAIASQRVIF